MEASNELSGIVSDLACHIDVRYLVVCEPQNKASDSSADTILRTHVRNQKKVSECYRIHNEFVREYSE